MPQSPDRSHDRRLELNCNVQQVDPSSATGHLLPSQTTATAFHRSQSPCSPLAGLRLQTNLLAEKNRQDCIPVAEDPIAEATPTAQKANTNPFEDAAYPLGRHASIKSLKSARRRPDSLSSIELGPAFSSSSGSVPGERPVTADPSIYSQQRSDNSSGTTLFNAGLPVRSSSIRSIHSARRKPESSPGSAMSSPGMGPLLDMTPLPSPISLFGGFSQHYDQDDKSPSLDADVLRAGQSSPRHRKKPSLKSRSVSEYMPEGMQTQRVPPRNIVASTSMQPLSPPEDVLHREEYLAVQRGLTVPASKPPTPPASSRSEDSDRVGQPDKPKSVTYEAQLLHSGKKRRWRAIRLLGEGQFSKVVLAQDEETNDTLQTQIDRSSSTMSAEIEAKVNRPSLVAIKVCAHGPAGGADAEKVSMSIRREIRITKAVKHPCLVRLLAVEELDSTTLLVLPYSRGGDLFDLASTKSHLLTPTLIQRIFAELVQAVQYLHSQWIVHRDIKLENILVNLTEDEMLTDWHQYTSPVITLTDLGLGRWIPMPPESPLLTTRCGSEDYAAPEVLMGQDYDGRQTDAWALGVVLYALIEGRLPFDPVPGGRRKSPTSHRIARCEWQWVRYADADGEWDAVKGKLLEPARMIVEGLLARLRNRWSLDQVQNMEWLASSIQGSLHCEDEEEEEEEEQFAEKKEMVI